MQYLAHSHTRREHSRVTAGHHIVAQLEMGMAWHLFQISQLRYAALPSQIAEVAGYLWERGWAERNGGNISYNITEVVDETITSLKPLGEAIVLPQPVKNLCNNYFIVTGTGKRMRYVHSNPMKNMSIIRISADGTYYDIIAEEYIRPTSELPSHLMIHDYLLGKGRNNKVVVHTHPIELVVMTHNPAFLEKDVLSKILWSMIPETKAFCPRGLGIIPYQLPSSVELAEATIRELDDYDVVMWEKHGVFAKGLDVMDAFDQIDVLSKSAKIYIDSKCMGFEPDGMSQEEMAEMTKAFNLPR
jgi:rhamnulose-1-phosphate aldolase